MGRYRGAVNRLSRREGVNLFLKSSMRRNDDKFRERLSQPPGQHGAKRQKLSDYGTQLREKQKMKRIYGVMEKQFRVFFQRASQKRGATGEILIQLLERRLDNVVYRLTFAATRREARQMVSHGLIFVNGRPVNVASYIVKPGEKITPRPKEANMNRVKAQLEKWQDLTIPDWLSLDRNTLEAKIERMPTKGDAALPVEESLIVELYSK
ncbi:MAG: 30S ribosomal protein S4 [Candidatus Omnitrophica bacterium]|nr:30S ribosomal protein S4 [Candidatus Omnitrophota bacterium]